MADLPAGPIIDRMRKAAGVATDIELGAYFGIGKSTAGGWRNRNTVPYDHCVDLARRKGISLDWLLLGVGDMERSTGLFRGVRDEPPADPRLQRLYGFLDNWTATRTEDDKVWLEMQLARSIPEYAEWIAARNR